MRCIIAIAAGLLLLPCFGAYSQDSPSTAPLTKEGLPNLEHLDTRSIDISRLPKDPSGQPLAARVNGRPITARRLVGAARRIVVKHNPTAAVPRGTSAAVVAPVLDDLVNSALLEDYATSKSLIVSHEEVDRAIEITNSRLPSGRKLQDNAVSRGLTIDEMRAEIRDQLLAEKVADYERYRLRPPSAEQLKEFRLIPGVNETSATVIRASHIALRCPPSDPPDRQESIQKRAEDILRRLLEDLDFAEAARRYSQDAKTSDLGGDLGYFDESFMFPAFNEAVFKLKPGEISSIIRGPMALHIVKVTARENTNIQVIYRADALKKRMVELTGELRAAAKIEKYL